MSKSVKSETTINKQDLSKSEFPKQSNVRQKVFKNTTTSEFFFWHLSTNIFLKHIRVSWHFIDLLTLCDFIS